ncbi:hypothetical protein [Kaistella chaponensis]|jgi:hypothetical protein|uniref:hypothetical protein n=1 Tax=Kaistella chaponensis TaxID=713588 RepID=UPI002D1FB1E9|nr:hypothetical protein [Kaistella chaponensis]
MQIEETILDSIRSRPRFKIFTDIPREVYTLHLKKFLAEKEMNYSGTIHSEEAIIRVKSEENYFWKPCLALRTEVDREENKTIIRGIFGPTSAVWTFFMFLNFIFGISWMLLITIWFVEKQIKSNDFPWALSASFVVLALLAITFIAARFGQIKARKEMQKLREFAEESIRSFENT